MARNFESASSEYLYTTGLLGDPMSMPVTVNVWFNADDELGQECLWFYGAGNDTNDRAMLVCATGNAGAGNNIQCMANEASGDWPGRAAETSTTYSAGVYNMATGVWAADDDRRAYLNGGGKGTNTASEPLGGGGGTHDTMDIGRLGDSSPNWYFDGPIAEVAIWDIALSDAEIASLYISAGVGLRADQVQSGNLIHWFRILGDTSPEPDEQSANTLTLFATPLQSTHPTMQNLGGVFVPTQPQRIVRHSGRFM